MISDNGDLMHAVEIRDRAAPVDEIQLGRPMTIAVNLPIEAADWIVSEARIRGITPEQVAEEILSAAAMGDRKPRVWRPRTGGSR
jgi:hypothetical protein